VPPESLDDRDIRQANVEWLRPASENRKAPRPSYIERVLGQPGLADIHLTSQ
jgi:hypothetical protein